MRRKSLIGSQLVHAMPTSLVAPGDFSSFRGAPGNPHPNKAVWDGSENTDEEQWKAPDIERLERLAIFLPVSSGRTSPS